MPVIIIIKVMPSSGKNKLLIDKGGQLKCYLKSPPEKGLANKELVKMLAKALGIASNNIEILTGATSRIKRLRINLDLKEEDVLKAVGLEKADKQLLLFK